MSADDRAHIEGDIESWLRQHEQKEILRFVTVGSDVGMLRHAATQLLQDAA